MKKFTLCFLILLSAINGQGQARRAMTIDDLIGCQRLADPQFAPDGQRISFCVKTMFEATNQSRQSIWIVDADGSGLHEVTPDSFNNWSPRWAPDGKRLAFLSDRSGAGQIWLLNLTSGDLRQITTHYTGVESFIWSHSGQKIAFESRVYPDLNDQTGMAKRDSLQETSRVKARVYDELLFRHWDTWWDHKRAHLFVLNPDDGKFIDVTPGDWDAPPLALGGGYDFTADDTELIFNSNREPVIATSTNNDIWKVAVRGGAAIRLTTKCAERDFKGNDHHPQFSPDGKNLAFLSMRRAGYEADKSDLFLLNYASGKFTNLTAKHECKIESFAWLPSGKALVLTILERARVKIKLLDVQTQALTTLVADGFNESISVSPDGNSLAYLKHSTTHPAELCVYSLSAQKARTITSFNSVHFNQLEMQAVEDFDFTSTDGASVHGLLIKPPFFESGKKYPLVYLVHGGPQGAWEDGWHYRWNPQLWAAQGYVIAMVNCRGSEGYGQQFVDGINRDWGGQAFNDLVAGQKYVVEKYPFIDPNRLAAAGASFGGYMMNWFAGHMDAFRYPFKTLISHDGSFNLYAMLLTTEELWFPEWEYAGPFWENEAIYAKHSPHQFIRNFKTPMLIIHGEKDYRLDYSEGMQIFTALRRQGVPARLVLFPDEGHFVLKPQNSRFWHTTVFDWLAKYLQ